VTAPASLRVEQLRIEMSSSGVDIVDDISLTISKGEVLGLVGESGSGKTTTGLAVLGHARRGSRIVGGRIWVGDRDMLTLSDEERRRARGGVVSYVPQDPSASLNPALRIQTQLIEVLEAHGYGADDAARRARVVEVMGEVLLPGDQTFLRRYPHQLSGGQQQRVGIAMAFACRPSVIVLDEPTTGLDVSTQSHVLATVREITKAHGAAALYVTHDLAVVATLADRVAVMYAGRLVEEGPTEELFRDAAHPYTRRLLAAIPQIDAKRALVGIAGRAPSPGSRPPGCAFAPRCQLAEEACTAAFPALVDVGPGHRARCRRIADVRGRPRLVGAAMVDPDLAPGEAPVLAVRNMRISYGQLEVVHGVDLALARQECLAIVGESGSGKTTLARTIAGLHREREGDVLLDGVPLAASSRERSKEVRRRIQYVFQNPYGSLNPRRTVGESVRRPLALTGTSGKAADRKVAEMLERVSLTAAYAFRYPDQLSGGERQRVAIARALICDPDVLVCDEVTSALDVSVQAAIVDLLAGLQRDLGLAMLFVTHNLPLVRSIAQRVAVMQGGVLVEVGTVDGVLSSPKDEYTRRLLSDTPQIEPAVS
jgi:peptide/nickel transport system ATP-binding protein